MILADELVKTTTWVEGKWVILKPYIPPIIFRIRDAFAVLFGKAVAVKFYKQ